MNYVRDRWFYFIGLLVVACLMAIACLAKEHKYNFKFTYISPKTALFQCYNGQKPDVQWLDDRIMILECDGE